MQEKSNEKRNEVLKLYEQGLSKSAIALMLDLSRMQVSRYFNS